MSHIVHGLKAPTVHQEAALVQILMANGAQRALPGPLALPEPLPMSLCLTPGV
jgi:hypothetical protein